MKITNQPTNAVRNTKENKMSKTKTETNTRHWGRRAKFCPSVSAEYARPIAGTPQPEIGHNRCQHTRWRRLMSRDLGGRSAEEVPSPPACACVIERVTWRKTRASRQFQQTTNRPSASPSNVAARASPAPPKSRRHREQQLVRRSSKRIQWRVHPVVFYAGS